jgi:uncharacterized protein YjbJ (UPF0337 family)
MFGPFLGRGVHVMNRDTLKGQWLQMKGKVREQWGKLTNDDLDEIEGNAEQLVGKLQTRYGYARQRAEAELDAFLAARAEQEKREKVKV